jgi:3'-5' exoribonuclease
MNAIADLAEDRVVEGVYAVARKQRLRTKGGAAYLALELVDPSGRVDARIWNDVDLLDGRFDEGDAVRVLGRVERFRDRLQLDVRSLEKADVDPGTLVPATRRDLDELDGFLEFLAAEVAHPGLAALLGDVLGDADIRGRLRALPATPDGHHGYAGGLLEHTVAVATLVLETCVLHPRLDSDLLMAAAIVHDAGRAREFVLGADFELSEEGRLLGHLAIGAEIVGAAAAELAPERRLELLNCVLSHHGPDAGPGRAQGARNGSRQGSGFASPEALALYRLNSLDASVKGALEHG